MPFFFDPDWDARIGALPLRGAAPAAETAHRWDNANVHAVEGTYGEYLLGKVAKVFPDRGAAVLGTGEGPGSGSDSGSEG